MVGEIKKRYMGNSVRLNGYEYRVSVAFQSVSSLNRSFVVISVYENQ